eukprot:546741-Prorocentrum_minimum.AAC.1
MPCRDTCRAPRGAALLHQLALTQQLDLTALEEPPGAPQPEDPHAGPSDGGSALLRAIKVSIIPWDPNRDKDANQQCTTPRTFPRG